MNRHIQQWLDTPPDHAVNRWSPPTVRQRLRDLLLDLREVVSKHNDEVAALNARIDALGLELNAFGWNPILDYSPEQIEKVQSILGVNQENKEC